MARSQDEDGAYEIGYIHRGYETLVLTPSRFIECVRSNLTRGKRGVQRAIEILRIIKSILLGILIEIKPRKKKLHRPVIKFIF